MMTDFVDIYVSALLFYVLSIHICLGKIEREMAVFAARAIFVLGVIFESVALSLFVKWYEFDYAVQDEETANWLSSERNNPYSDGILQLVFISNIARYTVLVLTVIIFIFAEFASAHEIPTPRLFHKDGAIVQAVMRLYVLCFSVLVPTCGMVVLDFYRPDEPMSPLAFSYVVGQDCDDVAGKTSTAELTPSQKACVSEFIFAKTEDDNAVFFTTYVTVLIFYTLMIVDSLEFVEHPLWMPRVKLFTGLCIVIELAIFFTTIVKTQDLIHSHAHLGFDSLDPFEHMGLENNTPLEHLTNGLISNVTMIRMVAIVVFYIVYLRASFEKSCQKLNICLSKACARGCACCVAEKELM